MLSRFADTGAPGCLQVDVMQKLVEALGGQVIVSEGVMLDIKHLVAVSLERTGHGQRAAVAHPQLGHDTVVQPLAVIGDVEVEQMGVGILHGAGYARCAVV